MAVVLPPLKSRQKQGCQLNSRTCRAKKATMLRTKYAAWSNSLMCNFGDHWKLPHSTSRFR